MVLLEKADAITPLIRTYCATGRVYTTSDDILKISQGTGNNYLPGINAHIFRLTDPLIGIITQFRTFGTIPFSQ